MSSAGGGDLAGERLVGLGRRLPALAEGAEVPAETGGPVGTIQARAVGLRREAHALGALGIVEPGGEVVQHIDALGRFRGGETLRLDLRIGERDRLDGLGTPGAVQFRQVHFRHQPVIAAEAEARQLGGAGMQEIAEPVEDQRLAVELDALDHVRVMAEDEVDILLAGGEPAPIGELPLVGHDAAFKPVMDGENAVIGRHGGELVHGRLEVGTVAVGGLSRFVRTGAILRLIGGHDADRGKGDARAVEVDAAGVDRLVEIAADAGIGDGLLGVGDGEMVERLLDALRAVIVGMVVGEREQIEAGVDQRLQRGG